jgi:hypothetical protein
MRSKQLVIGFVAFSALTALATVAAAQSTYHVVDDASGSCAGDPGTLYWAIEKANNDGGPSTVELDSSIAGQTIQLECPLVVKDELEWIARADVDVRGDTLGGNDIVTFDAPGALHSVLELRLYGGADTRGIFIKSGQEVQLVDSWVMQNETTSALDGAGIFVDQSVLYLEQCLIYKNKTAGDGGGVHASGSKVYMVDTTFDKNSAADGGGLYVYDPSGDVSVFSSTFSSNGATNGGAIALYDGPGGAYMQVVNSTFSSNSAAGGRGGGILFGDLGFAANSNGFIVNSTFYGNVASQGSGIAVVDGYPSVYNTALYRVATTANNCYLHPGADMSGHHDIWNDTSCPFGNSQHGSYPNTNPLLSTIANNGGPTYTHLPQATSPVISHGDAAFCPGTDQRGVTRTTCWMGSVEN